MKEAKIRFNEGDGVDLPLAVDLLSALFKTERTEGRVRFRGRLFVVTAHHSEGGMERYDVTRLVEMDVFNLDTVQERAQNRSLADIARQLAPPDDEIHAMSDTEAEKEAATWLGWREKPI